MKKELYVNGKKLIMEIDALQTKKFFRTLSDGREFEIETCKNGLIDEMDQILWPLENLKDMFGIVLGTEDSPEGQFIIFLTTY